MVGMTIAVTGIALIAVGFILVVSLEKTRSKPTTAWKILLATTPFYLGFVFAVVGLLIHIWA